MENRNARKYWPCFLVFILCLGMSLLGIYSLSIKSGNVQIAVHHMTIFTPKNISSPNISTEAKYLANLTSSPALVVHYVHFYPTPTSCHQLCFLDCVALLSVFRRLKPDSIYYHTNAPNCRPFDSCHALIPDSRLSAIKMVKTDPVTKTGRQTIGIVHHQADIAKLKILRDFGGIVMDMDVFMINGHVIRELMTRHTCILSREGSYMLNAGFSACSSRGSAWPKLILRTYAKHYRLDWYYNSAVLPYRLLQSRKDLQDEIFVDDTISDNPPGIEGYKMLALNGLIDWRRKIAFQSFYHNCKFDVQLANTSQTSFGELLRWIMYADVEPN